MKLGTEWWRTVRYAIKEERRTARLISILLVVGTITGTLIVIGSGNTVALTIG
ncbi:hypothetical protein [Streptomyces sp. NBC_01483]|uniref:hypothetical protein n=1 Tax=Streptomyces sp. NBC_01483 TaxID=2903883 RepID=UPI002E37D4CE|nr:hypothetical protein [Streptomyces sp. NBC_01483]